MSAESYGSGVKSLKARGRCKDSRPRQLERVASAAGSGTLDFQCPAKAAAMSTQPEHSDLDKTDELPVLDVAAYEASLAASEDPLASTDTWMVESLRESETVRDLESAKRARSRPAPPLITGSVDLSIIDRL